MSQDKFLTRKQADKNDERAAFANYVCDLLISQYVKGGSLDFVKEAEQHFNNNIRNFYEIINESVPLFALYNLQKLGKEEFEWDGDDFDEAIKFCEEAIEEYHYKKLKANIPTTPPPTFREYVEEQYTPAFYAQSFEQMCMVNPDFTIERWLSKIYFEYKTKNELD